MIALACHALFASAAIVATATIAATILPQRNRIARILARGSSVSWAGREAS